MRFRFFTLLTPLFLLCAQEAFTACQPGPTSLCLNAQRFQVEVAWKDFAGPGQGQAVALTGDTGYFWFFSNSNV